LAAGLRVLAEIVLGLLAVAAVLVCILGWRLSQGPLDVTWLVHRVQAHIPTNGQALRIGGASLAWEGFALRDQPLDLRVADVTVDSAGDGPRLRLRAARASLSMAQLLRGQIVPRRLLAEGVTLVLSLRADGSLATGNRPGSPVGAGGGLSWPAELHRVDLRDGTVILHDAALGTEVQARGVTLDLDRTREDVVTGSGHALLAEAGVQVALDLRASAGAHGGTALTAGLAPFNPAALAAVAPSLAGLAVLDGPVTLSASATLGGTQPAAARLEAAAGPATLTLGRGGVRLSRLDAAATLTSAELRLERLRVAFAPLPGRASPPVLTAQASATRASGRVHAVFGLDVDRVEMGDLASYWPTGTGGGARPWLTQNITAGHAHDAHLAGTLDGPAGLGSMTLSSLSGGLAVDEATVWWLRPVPPLVRVGGHVTVEGPDSLRIAFDRGAQDRLALDAGSGLRITGLQARDQFADIQAGLSGPLADALSLLNHPRLALLSRGGVDVVDPAGEARARLTLHVPLDDRVTMDDIAVDASAALSGVHLGRVVAGRDLDRAALTLRVTGDGLDIAGDGAVAGIPARLALQMDFRAGPPGQVLQHLSAWGQAGADQLRGAGVPEGLAAVLTGGTAGLRVDYAGHRDGTGEVQVDADLANASLVTPVGWSKAAGPASQAGARVLLDHGRLVGVDHLHAEGPGLAVVSRAQLAPGQPRALLLDRLQLGRTDAHGRIGFPATPRDPTTVRLSGRLLDLSAYLAKPDAKADAAEAQAGTTTADDAPGPPWSLDLSFQTVRLASDTALSPFSLTAASDGSRILRAKAAAGSQGELAASIVPARGTRELSVRAADAGVVLAAIGMGGTLDGGALQLDGRWDDTLPGAPLSGTATLDHFQLHQGAAIGRVLQAFTLYGLADALRGPGLRFSRLVAPFRWRRRVLHLANARAFSPSLGITAQGDIDLRRRTADVRGTVVPAYFFNQLLGDLPLVGRVFSPEKGGGVFAARYAVRGPLANPKVGLNPLSALTPGFLREGFGLFAAAPAKTP
jgi:uncharacterized protein YhdP